MHKHNFTGAARWQHNKLLSHPLTASDEAYPLTLSHAVENFLGVGARKLLVNIKKALLHKARAVISSSSSINLLIRKEKEDKGFVPRAE